MVYLVDRFKGKSASEIFLGSYDYKFLCMPSFNPWKKGEYKQPPFFSRDAFLGLLLAAVMGLQHAMAMIGGIITPPLLLYNTTIAGFPGQADPLVAAYLVNAALIVSGLTTLVQVAKIPIGGKYRIGTGLISVMGTSFTWLPIAQEGIRLRAGELSWTQAYGAVIGTFALCGITEVILSFVPPKVLRRMVPSFVSGVTVLLIGAGLIGSGFRNWGGGAFCAENYQGILTPPQYKKFSDNCYTFNTTINNFTDVGTCFAPLIIPKCASPPPLFSPPGNGEVAKYFGDGAYVGMGFVVIAFLVVLEIFGSPFLRNCNVILGLLFGCLVTAFVKIDGKSFWVNSLMDASPVGTFLWVRTFPLAIYAPLIFPTVIAYFVTTVETIGDIAATMEASRLTPDGEEHERTVQGGLLGDGVNSIFGCLAMSMPTTTFSQNNGVIAMTNVASMEAGIACGIWLIVAGVLAKIGAFIVSIPNCVLGGMTTFLFANVMVSGIKVINFSSLTRRNRFILAISLGLGLGVTIVPQWAINPLGLWPINPLADAGAKGARSAVIIFLSTGYCIGAVAAMILHLILPGGDDDFARMESVRAGKVYPPKEEWAAEANVEAPTKTLDA